MFDVLKSLDNITTWSNVQQTSEVEDGLVEAICRPRRNRTDPRFELFASQENLFRAI